MNETESNYDFKIDSTESMLSTIDNPFNPFDHFDEWLAYDIEKGHYSCNVLARFAHCSAELSEMENIEEINQAIDRIIEVDAEQKFIKVKRNS